jgi:hypothetical protein
MMNALRLTDGFPPRCSPSAPACRWPPSKSRRWRHGARACWRSQSAWAGKTDMAVANVVGSNIFNVLFILGLSAMITPLLVDKQLIRQEVPIMIGVSLLFAH